ncbi:MAG: hypothetical protein AAFX99_30890, partial [Myxococcota bacterium]
DFGRGPKFGVGGGAHWDILVVRLDTTTGEVVWDHVYPNVGADQLSGLFLDASGQTHLTGRMSGPVFDLSGGEQPLEGSGQLFAATLADDGQHRCSFASTGQGIGTRTIGATAVSPNGQQLIVGGGAIGSFDFGSNMIGDSESPLRRIFMQRFTLVE